MPNWPLIILVCLLMGAVPVRAAENRSSANPDPLSPEDRKIVAVLDILELMDLAAEMDMVQDINYLIEVDQNENPTD